MCLSCQQGFKTHPYILQTPLLIHLVSSMSQLSQKEHYNYTNLLSHVLDGSQYNYLRNGTDRRFTWISSPNPCVPGTWCMRWHWVCVPEKSAGLLLKTKFERVFKVPFPEHELRFGLLHFSEHNDKDAVFKTRLKHLVQKVLGKALA